MPIIWAWEYGSRQNLSQIRSRWFPLIKGEADFFTCFLQRLNGTEDDGFLHDVGDCTNESPGKCQMRDTVLVNLPLLTDYLHLVQCRCCRVGDCAQ